MQGKSNYSFEGVLVVVGAGYVDLDLLVGLQSQGAHVVAADGGADHCGAANIVPNLIIGDMDSVTEREIWAAKTKIIQIDEQETTDFEKCLYSCGAPITIALGMTGKRLDHSLAALDVLVRFSPERNLALVSETDLVLAVRGRFCFDFEPGARVSIHPVLPIAFENSSGLEYSLDGIKLSPGVRMGNSNIAQQGSVEIVPCPHENAPYLVIIQKKYLHKWMGS